VALQLGLQHPRRVRKLVIASASYTSDGLYPEVIGGIENITPELFDGTSWREAYDRTASDPSAFPTLVEKLKQLDMTPFDWPIDELAAPALILIGDSDGTRLEHAVEMFRRLGGGVFGDLAPELPASQLAILPGTTHVGMLERAGWISSMVTTFLAT
jgi:pimeloyl-ACP methyl ester carboxylesterase